MANIHDVARRARVSTATVSRVLSGADVVRPQTREAVMRAVTALGYVPNSNARSLSMGRSKMLGIVISDITNPFFPELLQRFTELAESFDFSVLMSHTNYDPIRVRKAVQRMLAHKIEAAAIMTSELDADSLRQLSDNHVPLVFLDSAEGVPVEERRTVEVDYEAGIRQAIDHLVKLGHRDIAFISGPLELRSAAWRRGFFLKQLQEHGIHKPRVATGDYRVEGGYRAMKTLLQDGKHPTAVITSNDLTAFGAVNALADAGLSIPHDVSIIGFDDIQMSEAFNPRLTTVKLSRSEIGTRAFNLLHASLRGEKPGAPQDPIATSLVIRESTAPPRRA